ncbi:MAG: hypothetical protein Tsb0034_10780 [Ekhidna sp.]
MEDKEELSVEESLALINSVINSAKKNYARGSSFHFLLWGWAIMIANLGHYVLWKFDLTDAPYVVWALTIPTAIISIVYGARKGSRSIVKNHLDSLYGYIWLGMFIGAIILLIFAAEATTVNGIILTFSGLGTFLTGITLRFKPSILGGIALFVAAIVAFNTPILEQYLVGAIGIFAGYLIPGYLLKKLERTNV